jgi:hypothetical protein
MLFSASASAVSAMRDILEIAGIRRTASSFLGPKKASSSNRILLIGKSFEAQWRCGFAPRTPCLHQQKATRSERLSPSFSLSFYPRLLTLSSWVLFDLEVKIARI